MIGQKRYTHCTTIYKMVGHNKTLQSKRCRHHPNGQVQRIPYPVSQHLPVLPRRLLPLYIFSRPLKVGPELFTYMNDNIIKLCFQIAVVLSISLALIIVK